MKNRRLDTSVAAREARQNLRAGNQRLVDAKLVDLF